MGTKIKKSKKSVVAAGPGARKRAKPTSKPEPKAAVATLVKATRNPHGNRGLAFPRKPRPISGREASGVPIQPEDA